MLCYMEHCRLRLGGLGQDYVEMMSETILVRMSRNEDMQCEDTPTRPIVLRIIFLLPC